MKSIRMKPVLSFLALSLAALCLHATPAAAETGTAPKKAPRAKAKPPKPEAAAYDAGVPRPTKSEVKYGPHARNVVDFWQASSDKPTPLVLVIHGGGWNSGSKERVNRFVDVKALLDAGISVASINYRLVPQAREAGVVPPVKAPMHDSARALQFLRGKAAEWNIDPARIAASGSSAGACTSLWLAYHDDLADPESTDPIARQSTRLKGAAVIGAQTTLDPAQAKEWIPNSRYGAHAWGMDSFAKSLAEREKILPWIQEYSPFALASKDDPPVALFYAKAPAMGKEEKDPTHSANFGVGLQEHCRKIGIGCELVHPGIRKPAFPNATAYLVKLLATP
jgi:acetyl esterase/lipase